MYTVTIDQNIPNTSYFTLDAVLPSLSADGKTVTVLNGKGTRRSTYQPGVESTVIVNYGAFVAVHIGFHHKHRGGQGWWYALNGIRKTWAQLPETWQKRTLKAFADKKAPAWAHAPGKLRSERKPPKTETRRGYKAVLQLADGQLRSIYDADTFYTIGITLSQAAKLAHKGGYYAFPTLEAARDFGKGRDDAFCTAVILEVETSGKHIEYENKYAATRITPLRIVEVIA